MNIYEWINFVCSCLALLGVAGLCVVVGLVGLDERDARKELENVRLQLEAARAFNRRLNAELNAGTNEYGRISP